MVILNQDKDALYVLNGAISTEEKIAEGHLMGYNIYGWSSATTEPTLLGTYDSEEDVEQIIQEIFKLIKCGKTHYSMPEAALDLEECDYVDY